MKKNTQRIGIPAGLCAALVFILILAACSAGGVGYIPPAGGVEDTPSTPQDVEYEGVDAEGNRYRLVITETLSGARYAVKEGDKYVLTIVSTSGETKTSSGTVASAGAAITLAPSKGSGTITVTVSSEELTNIIIGPTVEDDTGKQISTVTIIITLASPAALQLARDINAIEAGSAAAKGATVKLAGFVAIPSALAVPLGVTLDVTASGAALGLGSRGASNTPVTLTVNGTVIAGSNQVRLEDRQGTATINGSGTIRLNGKGSLLNVSGNANVANRKIILEGLTLVGVNSNNETLVYVGSGGEFVLKSGAITGNACVENASGVGGLWGIGGGVWVDGGAFTMEGGTITGNTAQGGGGGGGGGVFVWGTFTMTGGTITGNTVTRCGGGVYVRGSSSSFTMKGGTISANTVTGSTDGSNGGGVWADDGSAFIMEGGTITDNTITAGRNCGGGGVGVYVGTFTMKGGEITGNTAQGGDWAEGGGVNVIDGTFTMEGGAIIMGNIAQGGDAGGGGVRVFDGTFIMEDGAILGNTAQADGWAEGGGISVYDGTFTLKSGAITDNTAQGDGSSGGGVRVYDGTFTMENGAITGNTAQAVNGWADGGGVNVSDGTFTMKGGAITGNTVQGVNWAGGGGVDVGNGGIFTMNSPAVPGASGSISGNTSLGVASNVLNGGTVNGTANPNPDSITGLLW
jgi:hypothetical protein